MAIKTSQTNSKTSRGRETPILSTLWSFIGILFWLITWVLFGVLIYALLYGFLASVSGESISPLELASHLHDALTGEAGKESLAVLVAILTGLLGFAAQQWRYRAEIELKRIEQEREGRRRHALEEIDRLRDALQRSEYATSLSLYRLFQRQCNVGLWRDLGVEDHLQTIWARKSPPALRAWVELSERQGKPEVKAELKLSEMEAIIWGWRLDRERREQAQALLKEILTPQRLEELVELVNKWGDYRLLRSSIVGQRLEELSHEVSEEQRKFLQALQQWRKRFICLSPPWTATRPPEERSFALWLLQNGFSANPFGPVLAESDPSLAVYGIWPTALERARGPGPALVFGAPGSGRTAAALLLFYKCTHPPTNPEEDGVFPIWLEMDYWPDTSEAWIKVLGRAVAKALLQIYKQDPYTLFENPSGAAIAQLFLYCLPGPLGITFRHAGITGETLNYLLGEIEAYTGTVSAETTEPAILRDLIGWARPGDLRSTYIIVDVPNLHHSVDWARRNYSLALLMELAGPLMMRNVYLKLFFPNIIRHHLQPCWPLEPLLLDWTEEDLQAMLMRRLQTMSGGVTESLQIICSAQRYPPDPDTWLVRSAKGSPRRLVELGNQMLREAWQRASYRL